MNDHLTEQQLIDYQFELASEADAEKARVHLKRCAQCRRALEALQRKFAGLDLLAGEVQASEELVAATVEEAAAPRRARVLGLRQWPWLGAVAAAIVVGFALLLVSRYGPDAGYQKSVATDSPQEKSASVADAEAERAKKPETLGLAGEKAAVSRLQPAPSAPEPTRAVRSMAAAAPQVPMASAEEIAEKPPFAPASAIELVVLPHRENVQLTIYNAADLTLVREKRNLTLKRGWNWLQFMWAGTLIDPTSLSLEPLEHKDAVEIQQLVFPPRLRELGRWLIRSEVSGQVPFELTYFTSGLSWRAFYLGTLAQDEKSMRLEGYVRVDNQSGEEYEDAQTRLIVGRLHLLDQIGDLARRQYAYGSPVPAGMGGGRFAGLAGQDEGKKDRYSYYFRDDKGAEQLGQLVTSLKAAKEIKKEGLSEYFLYTIGGTETIPNEWGKRLLSFETDDIPVSSLYKYDEQRWGTRPVRFLSFANDEEHKLGATPLPNGQMRIYGQVDAEAHLSYVGATAAKYIPVGEEVELNLGPARLVEVTPTLMNFRTANYVFDANDNVAGWDEVRTWKIELTNARTVPIEIEITRGFDTPYWTLEQTAADVSYEKYDATHARFGATIPPRGKQEFEYTVTTYHGVRAEALSDNKGKQRN